MSLYVAPP